jgi:hypothetical protein
VSCGRPSLPCVLFQRPFTADREEREKGESYTMRCCIDQPSVVAQVPWPCQLRFPQDVFVRVLLLYTNCVVNGGGSSASLEGRHGHGARATLSPSNGARTCSAPQRNAPAAYFCRAFAGAARLIKPSPAQPSPLPQKLNLPTPGCPPKALPLVLPLVLLCSCSAAPDSPRLALNPFCQPEQRDDGLRLCLRRDCPCYKPLRVSSSPILSSHIPRLQERRTAR